ncbi:hypothetical protein JTB14_025850 [Gonioctena quinquepunctata]|nr:hypothetical protein JTB14_025850 [Gonioctena quinquepunctata]
MDFAKDSNGRYMCLRCPSSYKQKGHLVRHLKYACGVEPQFECPICLKKFKHSDNLKVHCMTTHGNKNLVPQLTKPSLGTVSISIEKYSDNRTNNSK